MTLTPVRTAMGWMVRYEGEGTDKILEVFGTTLLPTTFQAMADPGHVYQALVALNPGHTIRMEKP